MQQLAAGHTTMMIVTHEMHLAAEVLEHVRFMDGSVIVAQGERSRILSTSAEERTGAFLRTHLSN